MSEACALAALGCPVDEARDEALAKAVEAWRRAFREYLSALGRGLDLEFLARERFLLLRAAVIALSE